jgi:transmembrane sensor
MDRAILEKRSEDPLLITAADWFERLQHPSIGIDEVTAWQRWMGERSQNREAFEQIQDTWEKLSLLPAPDAADANAAKDAYTGDVSVARWQGRAAAPARKDKRWRMYAVAATVLLTLAAGIMALNTFDGATHTQVFETGHAEHREVRLPDGSLLTLGGQSLLWIEYSRGSRSMVLDRGEAFFEVAQDRRRPFVVRVGDSQVAAVGTAFNVRRSAERITVAVAEGAVKVGSRDAIKVIAGERLVVDPLNRHPRPEKSGWQTIAAWRTGQLQYLGEPLKFVIADVNRYSTEQITIAEGRVGELLVSGTVFEKDVAGWLASLEEILPVRVVRLAPGKVLLERADGR